MIQYATRSKLKQRQGLLNLRSLSAYFDLTLSRVDDYRKCLVRVDSEFSIQRSGCQSYLCLLFEKNRVINLLEDVNPIQAPPPFFIESTNSDYVVLQKLVGNQVSFRDCQMLSLRHSSRTFRDLELANHSKHNCEGNHET